MQDQWIFVIKTTYRRLAGQAITYLERAFDTFEEAENYVVHNQEMDTAEYFDFEIKPVPLHSKEERDIPSKSNEQHAL